MSKQAAAEEILAILRNKNITGVVACELLREMDWQIRRYEEDNPELSLQTLDEREKSKEMPDEIARMFNLEEEKYDLG